MLEFFRLKEFLFIQHVELHEMEGAAELFRVKRKIAHEVVIIFLNHDT